MPHRIVDTNVPLTAAGTNDVASDTCQLSCVQFVDRVLKGEIQVVLDEADEVLLEYGKNVPFLNRSEDIAGQFLIHLYSHQFNSALVHRLKLEKTRSDNMKTIQTTKTNGRRAIAAASDLTRTTKNGLRLRFVSKAKRELTRQS